MYILFLPSWFTNEGQVTTSLYVCMYVCMGQVETFVKFDTISNEFVICMYVCMGQVETFVNSDQF